MTNRPIVSVILTTCGRVPLLQQAIQSVLNQEEFGGADLELIVVCDGGWPESFYNKIVRKACAGSFHPIEIVYADLLAGPDDGIKRLSQMINLGLEVAHGDFISYLCDDDVWLPSRMVRMLTLAESGAGWAVDRVRWTRSDGVVVPHSAIGNFLYAEPLEVGHAELVEALAGLGSNWICHDCVVHRRTADRWPEIENHTPVDWRFWCSLWRRGLRPKVSTEVGAEAFYPGAWRAGLTIEHAVKARNLGGGEMVEVKTEVVQYANNSGSQIEIVPTADGKGKQVPPGGRVDIRLVTTPSGEMFPAFVPEGRTAVPMLLPKTDPDFLGGVDLPEPGVKYDIPTVGPLVGDAPVEKKKPFRVTESKSSEPKLEASYLKTLFKSQIVGLLKDRGIKASKSKTKAALIDAYLNSRQ